jgi:flagellin-like hook-associated protein FlgL
MISTGKVASAKDNTSVWAISKVMESDVKALRAAFSLNRPSQFARQRLKKLSRIFPADIE